MWLVGLQTATLPCDAALQSGLPLCTTQEAGVTTVCTLASAQRSVTVTAQQPESAPSGQGSGVGGLAHNGGLMAVC